jgi:hypothetical protein
MKRELKSSAKTNPILQTSLPLHLYANDASNKSLIREWNISIYVATKHATFQLADSITCLVGALGKREGSKTKPN